MRRVIFLGLSILLLITLGFVFALEEDAPESKDHPLLSRYPGSVILSYSQKAFDEYHILLGPVKSTSDRDIKNVKRRMIAGRVTKILYQCPKQRSNFEVFENYRIALEKAGFRTLYEDRGENLKDAGYSSRRSMGNVQVDGGTLKSTALLSICPPALLIKKPSYRCS